LEKDNCGGQDAIEYGVTNAVLGIQMPMAVGTPPQLLSTHSCKDGSIGVSDLIGGEKKKEPEGP
jgi:hypothetical protein